MMSKKEKIILFIKNDLREYDVYDCEVIDLIESICKSAYEKGICNNKYLEELKKVKND